MRLQILTEILGFQLVWLACALGAGHGHSWPGLLAACVFITLQISINRYSTAVITTMLASGIVGFAADSLLAATGLIRYAAPWPSVYLAPAWVVALWLAFGTTVPTTTRMLGRNAPLKASVMGAVFGSLAYVSAVQLHALDISAPAWLAYGTLGIVWIAALPCLVALSHWTVRREAAEG